MNARKPPSMQKPSLTRTLIWIGILSVIFLVFFGPYFHPQARKISYSRFKEEVYKGTVSEVTFDGDKVTGSFNKPVTLGTGKNKTPVKNFRTVLQTIQDPNLYETLEQNKVVINAKPEERSWFATLLISLLPWILIIGFFVWSSKGLRQRMGGLAKEDPLASASRKPNCTRKGIRTLHLRTLPAWNTPRRNLMRLLNISSIRQSFKNLGGSCPMESF